MLCGGLGSSAYVREQLSLRLLGSQRHPRARSMEIIVCETPQLAVVKGLVIDRMRKLQTGLPVVASRRCRMSYGILTAIPYDARKHASEEQFLDPFDQRLYANNMIQWIIKKGDKIKEDSAVLDLHKWTAYYEPGTQERIMKDQVVASQVDVDELPESLLDSEPTHSLRCKYSANTFILQTALRNCSL